MNLTAYEFITKVEEHIWSDERINSFCGYNSKSESDNSTDIFNNNEVRNITKKKSDKYKTPFIIMTCLLGASLIAIAFLSISLFKLRKNNSVNKSHSSEKSSTSLSIDKKQS